MDSITRLSYISRFSVAQRTKSHCRHMLFKYVPLGVQNLLQVISLNQYVVRLAPAPSLSSWSKTRFNTAGRGGCYGSRKDGVRCASDVVLTSSRYKNQVKRGSYAVLNDLDISLFEKIVPGRVITSDEELTVYNTDWLKTVRGESKVLLRPKTTDEVSAIVKYCSDRNLAISPQGGNTSMVGGSVPVFDEVIVSTQLMNKIISLDPLSGILVCQAGCILENLYQYVQEYGLTMPLDLGAKGSCHIGGNLATNAGGIRLLRYGSLHGSVLGIEAVLPDGQVLDCLSTLRKDNTGYDLKQLFIGSEGTLGVITAVSIICPQQPQALSVAFLGCESFTRVLEVFKSSKFYLGEVLSAFEFMDNQSMTLVKENLGLKNPISDHQFYVLVECSGSNGQHDEEKLMSLLQHVMDKGHALDGIIATDFTKIKNIWNLREGCPRALLNDGYCYKYDVSLPLSVYYQLVEDMRLRLKDKAHRVVAYGHVGDANISNFSAAKFEYVLSPLFFDPCQAGQMGQSVSRSTERGNLHLNITSKEYNPETMALVEPFVYDWVAKYRGSISAEHGLGFKKRNFIYHSKTPSAVSLMTTIKKAIDPKGIMNPYKVLPDVIKI